LGGSVPFVAYLREKIKKKGSNVKEKSVPLQIEKQKRKG
jgi:hypothetical protein